MEYLIEAMDDNERWYLIERRQGSGHALDRMSDLYLSLPTIPLRIVMQSVTGRRELICLHDPRPGDL